MNNAPKGTRNAGRRKTSRGILRIVGVRLATPEKDGSVTFQRLTPGRMIEMPGCGGVVYYRVTASGSLVRE